MNAPENDRAAWLRGSSATCSIPPRFLDRPWRLVLLGAPGVGKGSQAEFLTHHLSGCHLSTGDVFRAAGKPCGGDESPAMIEALRFMRKGQLVPDATVWALVRERAGCIRCRGGFVLDGFPRTRPQAESFHQLLTKEGIRLDAVLNYELPVQEILSRLGGRRICEKCKTIFHEKQHPPKVPGICDKCGGELIQREDDRPEAIMIRLDTYIHDTQPLIEFYRDQRLLVTVSAQGTPEEVFSRTLARLENAITDGPLRSRDPRDAIHGIRADHHTQKNTEPL